MTLSNVLSMLLLALADALNPATIATMMIILPIVKEKWHSLIFIAGTFLVYFITGIIVFIGVDKYLKSFIIGIAEKFSMHVGIIELLLAAIIITIAIVQAIKLINRIIKEEPSKNDYMAAVVKMVNPSALVILAVSSTLMDIPTAIPYFGFIGILTNSGTSLLLSIFLFIVYCLIYVLPMIILYLMFTLIQGERFNRIESGFRSFINTVSEYLLPVILLALGVLLIVHGVDRVLH